VITAIAQNPKTDIGSFIDQHNAAPTPFKPAFNILVSIERFSIRSTPPDLTHTMMRTSVSDH
jgi:hypothetical protein